MHIAFIMLCHKNPEQINMLIDKLSECTDADIYIHVDMNHSRIRDQIKRQGNVQLLNEQESYHIRWGSVEIVKATLQLISKVRGSGKTYDYIWLISGQDYPICHMKEIEWRLKEKPGMNYIETILPDDDRYNWYRKLYELSYPSWINNNNIFIKLLKRSYMAITGGHRHTFSFFVRKKPFDFDFSFGSQWWTLTEDAAYEILEYSDCYPEVLKYYEKSIIPDESFFQTLFMRGPFSEKRTHSLTYVNWGKNRRSPVAFSMNDMEKIHRVSKKYCFARKFDYPDNSELMKEIDNNNA